jgi:hypothetical protein
MPLGTHSSQTCFFLFFLFSFFFFSFFSLAKKLQPLAKKQKEKAASKEERKKKKKNRTRKTKKKRVCELNGNRKTREKNKLFDGLNRLENPARTCTSSNLPCGHVARNNTTFASPRKLGFFLSHFSYFLFEPLSLTHRKKLSLAKKKSKKKIPEGEK